MTAGAAQCRSCGGRELVPVLSLGSLPLANALLTDAQLKEPEPRYPLDLVRCAGCTLAQITETVAPELLFREYAYFSSFSESFLRHAEQLAERLVRDRRLGAQSLVVEAASNDGYLLQYYVRQRVPVLGIEPARNVAEVARRERGVDTVAEFFGAELAAGLRREGRLADVFHANNVLAHVADLNDFVRGISILLEDDGVAVLEVPYVKDMIDGGEFDTIYHEHLCYFSLTALQGLFARHGLRIVDVEKLKVHGGSLRVFAGRSGAATPAVAELLGSEQGWGVGTAEYYDRFGRRVSDLKVSLRKLLLDLKSQGSRIAGYGAAAKATILLNYFGIGGDVVDFVVDRSPHKQGRYIPGVHVPVRDPKMLLDARPDYVLLLAWNLADEVLAQQAEYRARGGRFVVPIPELRVV